MNQLSYYNDVTKNAFVSCLTRFASLTSFLIAQYFFLSQKIMALMKYWHKNDNLRMIYQLHFCFESFRFWLYKQSTCIHDLFSIDFIISENYINEILINKMSIFAYETYTCIYCKHYNISCQVIYTFNISQYCIYVFHAL